ncbi:MAG: type II toxin-antitoxin system RelE/ParE family toxin [Acetobacteraceae bacterium]
MARFRLSRPAQVEFAHTLAISAGRWGAEGRRRYAAILAAAMHQAAADPNGALTRGRPELLPGLRSLHIRHARSATSPPRIERPVHVLYDRVVSSDPIEIIRP